MNYLGHNEFGLDHRPWKKQNNYKDLNDINYWLEQWLYFYKNIFIEYKNENKCLFLIYEKLPELNYIKKLLKKLNLDVNSQTNLNFFINKNKDILNLDFNLNLYKDSKELYNNFFET